jgi:hypothetical protein
MPSMTSGLDPRSREAADITEDDSAEPFGELYGLAHAIGAPHERPDVSIGVAIPGRVARR